MRPLFLGCTIPLPLPNHPNGILAGVWEGVVGRLSHQFWINPMRPSFVGRTAPLRPYRERGKAPCSNCDVRHLLWSLSLGTITSRRSDDVTFWTSSCSGNQLPAWDFTLPDLSIIIATHNRADLASQCLDALLAQCTGQSVEIVVVDSASDPAAVTHVEDDIQRQTAHYPDTPIKFIPLDKPGVAKARNIGVESASSEWVATLDDDALVCDGWVTGALEAIEQAPQHTAIIQGRINPKWPTNPSPQIGPRWQRFLSIVQFDGTFEMIDDLVCSGANMLLRRADLVNAGGYDEDFGRVGNSLESGIDTALTNAILKTKRRIYYSDGFPVDHVIHADRLDLKWLSRRSRMDGRAEARLLMKTKRPLKQYYQIAKSLGSVSLFSILLLFARQNSELLIRRDVNVGLLEEVFQRRRPSKKET